MIKIPCKFCDGKGTKPLAPALATVLAVMPKSSTRWLALAGVRQRLLDAGVVMSSAALSAKLAKLVEHGLLKRSPSGDSILWSRS